MTVATQTFQFSSQQEILFFSEKFRERAELLEDLARVEQHKPEETTYSDSSLLDTVVDQVHADSQGK